MAGFGVLDWGLEKTEGQLVSLMFKCLVQLQNASAHTRTHTHTLILSQGIPRAWGRQEEEAICLQGDDMQKTIEKAREPQR